MCVFLPPVYICMRKGHNAGTLIINIILTLCGLLGGIIHALCVEVISCLHATGLVFLPPVGLYCVHGKCSLDVLICFLLTLTWFGGMWYGIWRADKPQGFVKTKGQ